MKTSILSRSLLAVLALATTLSMLAGAEVLFTPPAAPTQVVVLPAVTITHHRDLALTTVSLATDAVEAQPVLALDAAQRDPFDR